MLNLLAGRDYCTKCGSRVYWFSVGESKPNLYGITGKAAPICLWCNHVMCTECGKKRAVRPGFGVSREIGGKFFKRRVYSNAYCLDCLKEKICEEVEGFIGFIPSAVLGSLLGLRVSQFLHVGWSVGIGLILFIICIWLIGNIQEKYLNSFMKQITERIVKIIIDEKFTGPSEVKESADKKHPKIVEGMEAEEVINLLGQPDQKKSGEDFLRQFGMVTGSKDALSQMASNEYWLYQLEGVEYQLVITNGRVSKVNKVGQ